jgi:hypothetical protein
MPQGAPAEGAPMGHLHHSSTDTRRGHVVLCRRGKCGQRLRRGWWLCDQCRQGLGQGGLREPQHCHQGRSGNCDGHLRYYFTCDTTCEVSKVECTFGYQRTCETAKCAFSCTIRPYLKVPFHVSMLRRRKHWYLSSRGTQQRPKVVGGLPIYHPYNQNKMKL